MIIVLRGEQCGCCVFRGLVARPGLSTVRNCERVVMIIGTLSPAWRASRAVRTMALSFAKSVVECVSRAEYSGSTCEKSRQTAGEKEREADLS